MTEVIWEGTPIAKGIGIGSSYLLQNLRVLKEVTKPVAKDKKEEVYRYQQAIKASISELELLQRQLATEKAFEGVAVLDTHLELLHDPILTIEIEEEIKRSSSNSLFVLQKILSQYEKKFENLKDPFFQERFRDIQDVASRVMQHLGRKIRHRFDTLPEGVVLFASDLTPSEVASIQPGKVAALVTERGGATSHSAIIAKAKGIPYVSHLTFDPTSVKNGLNVIVDGEKGLVILNPCEKWQNAYSLVLKNQAKKRKKLQKSYEPPKTLDGIDVIISLNVGTLDDLPFQSDPKTACGLFRTEFLLDEEGSIPGEDEQFEIYKQLLTRFKDKPVVIRAFDLGGDKGAIVKEHLKEENPALGLRAIRLLLKEVSIFKLQIRALLRASPHGHLKFLLPMITSHEEVVQTKELISEIKVELEKEGFSFAPFAGIGCMIEVPSAALILDTLAEECDFFSIGTNDLLQFLLAVDRDQPQVIEDYSPFHPSVLRLLHHIVQEAARAKVSLSVCGEIASDPTFIPLLLGLGIREFSVNLAHLPLIHSTIASIDSRIAHQKVQKALTFSSTKTIKKLFEKV
jgi:phosphotransferase system enzyme I (PtsI)